MTRLLSETVAIIGAGQLGSALLEGLVAAGIAPTAIHAATRTAQHAEQLAERFGVIAADTATAASRASIVAVAVRPGQVAAALDEIADHLNPDAVVVSLAASPDLVRLAEHLPPGCALVRAMPNTAMAALAGLTAICPANDCPPSAADRVRALFEQLGSVLELPESQLGLLGSLSGHGQAVTYYLADALVQWGVMQGFSRTQARDIVAKTIHGAAVALNACSDSPAELQNRLTTPGGSTVRTMTELDAKAVRAAIINAL